MKNIMRYLFGKILFAAFFLVIFLPLHAQQPGCDVEGYRRDRPCGGMNIPSQNQGKASSVNRTQEIQNAIGAMGAAMEQSARQQAERERQEDMRRQQEEWTRQQQEQARKQQVDQQVQAAVERARQDPSLNPFGKRPPDGDSPTQSTDSPLPFDTSADLTGKSCKWMVVRDAESCSTRMCFYSEGQTVAVGSRAYRCESGQWTKLRDCNQSLSDLRKNECLRDIFSAYGTPEAKEIPAQNIYQKD